MTSLGLRLSSINADYRRFLGLAAPMIVSLKRFRTLLTEINVVLRGLASLEKQTFRLNDALCAEIADQLEESLWPLEATDATLSLLIEEVAHGSVISEEIASATKHIDAIRVLLSALSHIVERSFRRVATCMTSSPMSCPVRKI
jgi:hypothetical protein